MKNRLEETEKPRGYRQERLVQAPRRTIGSLENGRYFALPSEEIFIYEEDGRSWKRSVSGA